MNAEQLAHLVEDIVGTWPAGTRGRIWTQALADLDHDVARGVYEHLRDHAERPPTPGQYLALTRTVTPDYGWQHTADTGPPIALADYLARHDDDALRRVRAHHPTARTR